MRPGSRPTGKPFPRAALLSSSRDGGSQASPVDAARETAREKEPFLPGQGCASGWYDECMKALSWFLVFIACGAVAAAAALVVQRAAARATRALSGFQEYALPPVVALPFLSGFLVMHPQWNPVSHESMLLVHVLSADLLMVLIPLTKLTHAVLVPGVQLVAELGWHWPPDAGSKLARTLGKEGVPI